MREILIVGFAGCYLRLVVLLCRVGAPIWLVNALQMLLHAFVPESFRIAAKVAWLLSFWWRRDPESNWANRICNPVHNRFAIAPCYRTLALND